MSSGIAGFGIVFGIVFVLVTLFIVAVFVIMVVALVKRGRAVREEGLDPLTGDIQLAGQLSRSQLMAPAAPQRTVPERLAEVDELLRTGAISAAEHEAQRARILADL
ncbi:MAG TPA: SHOCT domain-containing protein [Angustibacter sp.]|nr:SHOCT domain-containing protein [Angustibacter sp.]